LHPILISYVIITIMKKIYLQPTTLEVKIDSNLLMIGEGSDAQKDWTGDAPLRQFSGNAVQGLKYLI